MLVSSNGEESTQSVLELKTPWDDILEESAETGRLPLGQIDAKFSPRPLVLSVNFPSNGLTTEHLSNFIEVINQDFKRVGNLISMGEFKLEIFNLSHWANIDDPEDPITWRVYFNGAGRTVSSISKCVFTDNRRQQEIIEKEYEAMFMRNNITEIIRKAHQGALQFYSNEAFKKYVWRDEKYNWHVVNWDENGNIVKEYVEGPGRTIAAKKNIIGLFENDPRKSNYVNEVKAQLEAIENAINTNE